MKFLHYSFNLGSGDIVEVTLDKQANVRLLDPVNFQHYKKGKAHRYFGGLAKVSPLRIKAPHAGRWHLVIDLGGFEGRVKASVRTIKGVI